MTALHQLPASCRRRLIHWKVILGSARTMRSWLQESFDTRLIFVDLNLVDFLNSRSYPGSSLAHQYPKLPGYFCEGHLESLV